MDRPGAAAARARVRGPRRLRRARHRGAGRDVRRPVLGDGRGPARRLVRRSAGNISQYQWHRQRIACNTRGIRLALQRPCDRLSRPPGFRARRRRAVGGHPANGAQRPRRGRRDVHARYRVGLRPGGVHHVGVRIGRARRAGRHQPGRVLRRQAQHRSGQARDPAQVGRRQGAEDGLHGHALDGAIDRDHRGFRGGSRPVLDFRRGGRGPGPRRRGDRAPLRTAHGHRMGTRRPGRPDVHPPGASRDGQIARGKQRHPAPLPHVGRRARGRHRSRDRPEDRAGRRPPRALGRGNGARAGRRRARHGDDRSRLGARDEARGGDRHQPGRPHVPRGDHRARARDSGGRGMRRRHHLRARRRRGHGVVRGGRHGSRLQRHRPVRDRRRGARPHAAVAHQDHDERRQPRARVRVPAPAQRGRGACAARVHHQSQRRHPPEGAARSGPAAAGDRARDRRARRRLRQRHRVLHPEDRRRRGDHRRRVLTRRR